MTEELARLQTQQQQHSNFVSNGISEEEAEELRYNLAQALEAAENTRQNAESLRAPATIDVTEEIQTEEGSQSVAEQIKLQVDALRVELEAQHDERVNQLEDTFRKRSDNMRNQLNKKLLESKDQMRQALAAEHEQALDALRSTHQLELEQLETRHHEEIAELRRNEQSTINQLKETWLKEHSTTAPEAERTITTEDQTPKSPWKPTEAEAREFVSTNATVRSILRSNISSKVKEAKDALTIELKEEHEKLLAQRLKEVQDKADTAKEHAVYTETKRNSLKLNLADNRSKVAQAKLDVVQKAAQETPEKPVGEVWAIAKDAKPPVQAPPAQALSVQAPPAQAPPAQVSQSNAPPVQNVPRGTTFGQPTPIRPTSPQPQSSTQSINLGVPASTEAQENLQQRSDLETTNVSAQPQDNQGSNPSAAITPADGTTLTTQPAITQPAIAQPENTQPGPQSSLPVKLQPNSAQHHPNAGTGPGIVRGLQQSGLPIARGGLGRGVPYSRGRGHGFGRGGPQTLDTNKSQGNKRARDESQDGTPGNDEGNGKRIRGGFAGS